MNITRESQETMGTNLIGRSTGNEFVTDVTLVLGSTLILNTVMINVRAMHIQIVTGDPYVVVILSTIVIVAEPTHDYDVCKACGSKWKVVGVV